MQFVNTKNKTKGFTLIELLVVIAIIGLLSAVIIGSLNVARSKAKDAARAASMNQIQTALVLYHDSNNAYPSTNSQWWGVSQNGLSHTTSGINAYIPGLTPKYIGILPVDPSGVRTGWSGYLYRSDGKNYKLLDNSIGPKSFPKPGTTFYDPVRPTWAWKLCSGEPACSSW